MIFLSAQSDHPYYHWQVEVMLLDFMRAGVNPNQIEVVFATQGRLSAAGRLLANTYPFVRFFSYENTIRDSAGYAPLCRPHVLAKHFDRFPGLSKEAVFYHDCDILFRALPDLRALAEGPVCHLSDTVGYVGASYIRGKGEDLLPRMAEIVGIDPRCAIDNEPHSGGAQYLLKGIDAAFWRKVEADCRSLYRFFCEREAAEREAMGPARLKGYNPIQKWCADMWAVLWNLWARGLQTRVEPQLSFSWATSKAGEWERHRIFHNAGVTEALKASHFYKGEYIHKDPFQADLGYVKPDNCSWRYAQAILKAKVEREHWRRVSPYVPKADAA